MVLTSLLPSAPESAAASGARLLGALRRRLAVEGLRIVMPLPAAAFDLVVAETSAPRLGDLLSGARGAIVVGDGGPLFFQRFQRQGALAAQRAAGNGGDDVASRDPLDDYTRQVLETAVPAAWAGWAGDERELLPFRVVYPFVNARPALPFQRLGHAAGLPSVGPLGLQVHPRFGPWWAYRALIAVSFPVEAGAALTESCPDCPRPCVSTCPGGAVTALGLHHGRCIEQRSLVPDAGCRRSCAARASCPVGADHRYSPDQLAFHMEAALR